MSELTCFQAYDVRGVIDENFDEAVAYKIGRAVAQHFNANSVVLGYDARLTSSQYALAVSDGVRDTGADVFGIGLSGTEEMYWAVSEFSACAGVMVTASHNPINYNGLKIVKSGSRPLNIEEDFNVIKALAEKDVGISNGAVGRLLDRSDEARNAYVERVIRFINPNSLRPLKVLVNSGNGAAGPTFDAIARRLWDLGVPVDFVRMHHEPDHTFPNGIPNPMLPENHFVTSEAVICNNADFGVAFDGDFDRCFFFDEEGKFVPSEYIIGLIASSFLEKEPGATIVHDPRIVWSTQELVHAKRGKAVQSKTGHAFVKSAMRLHGAVYGGEISAHHYFRDFAYCDSGMIPWCLVAELVSLSNCPLSELVRKGSEEFPSSGEINFAVTDANLAIDAVLAVYLEKANSVDNLDGVSLSFDDWRFNLRRSNTEPLVRLNLETKGDKKALSNHIHAISNILNNYSA